MRIFLNFFIFILLATFAYPLYGQERNTVPITAYPVEKRLLKERLYFVGDIKGINEVLVYPKATGKLLEKKAGESKWVQKEEVIALIDRDITGYDYQPAIVKSPINGVVARFYPDIGDNLSVQTPVALVSDFRQVEINIEVPQKFVSKVKIGTQAIAYVDTYPDKVFSGEIEEMASSLDRPTRTLQCKVRIDNPGLLLKPGMFAKVYLIIRQKEALAVHRDSVVYHNHSSYVYVVRDHRVKKREVSLGIEDGLFFEVKEGIDLGDLVVLTGKELLSGDSKVKVVRTESLEEF